MHELGSRLGPGHVGDRETAARKALCKGMESRVQTFPPRTELRSFFHQLSPTTFFRSGFSLLTYEQTPFLPLGPEASCPFKSDAAVGESKVADQALLWVETAGSPASHSHCS